MGQLVVSIFRVVLVGNLLLGIAKSLVGTVDAVFCSDELGGVELLVNKYLARDAFVTTVGGSSCPPGKEAGNGEQQTANGAGQERGGLIIGLRGR